MTADQLDVPPAVAPRPAAWFFNAYVQLGIGAGLVTASELLLKTGATASDVIGGAAGVAGALRNGWTWLAIGCYVLSFFCGLYVLRSLPVGIAFAFMNVTHVLVPLGAWALLGESISPRRWLGIALVLGGTTVLVKPAAKAEETL